jgi:hypothetical protein
LNITLKSQKAQLTFSEKFKVECIEGSAISESIFDCAIDFVEDTGRWEPNLAMGLDIHRNWQTKPPHNFKSCAVFLNEDGSHWQFKPENPRVLKKGKPNKYETEKGKPTTAYTPAVTVSEWVKIALANDLDDLLPSWVRFAYEHGNGDLKSGTLEAAVQNSSLSSFTRFWDWIEYCASVRAIRIVHTEGGKKSLSLLSCGHIALGFVGVNSGYRVKDEFGNSIPAHLIDSVQRFCQPNVQHIIAFDEDIAIITQRRVDLAASRYGHLLERTAGVVSIAHWDGAKGIDDLARKKGRDAVDEVLDKAEPLKRVDLDRQVAGAMALTMKPEILVDSRYLDPSMLPHLAPGDILAISSPVGTGKTEILKKVIAEHRKKFPEAWIFILGYRNVLLYQTSMRVGLLHLHLLQKNYPGSMGYALRTEGGALLCLDSINLIPWDLMPANSLIIHDEGEATAAHALEGGTLGDRQNEVLELWSSVITRVLSGGGNMMVAEESLTNIGLNFYRELAGNEFPIRLMMNEWKKGGNVKLSTSPDSGFIAETMKRLAEGGTVVVPTDSQVFGEKLERVASDYKVFRLDAKLAHTPNGQRFQTNPDEFIAEQSPNLIIMSPTAESGVSIETKGLDVRAYLCNANTRSQYQHFNRVRKPQSVHILTKEYGMAGGADWQTNPFSMMRQWTNSLQITAQISGLQAEFADKEWSAEAQTSLETLAATLKGTDKRALRWLRHAANLKARNNLLRQNMAENLEKYLIDRGYTVERIEYAPSKEIRERFNQAKLDIWADEAKLLFDAEGRQSESIARSILSSGNATYQQRVNAQKSLLQAQLPETELDEEFLHEIVVKKKGQAMKALKRDWLGQHPEIAQRLDRISFANQIQKGFVLPWRVTSHSQEAAFYKKANIEQLTALAETGEEIREDSTIVQAALVFGQKHRSQLYQYFKLNVSEGTTGIQAVGKLIKRFGYRLRLKYKKGPRGAQMKIWVIERCVSDEHKARVFDALNRKWAAHLNAVDPICNKEKEYMKIEDTKAGDLVFLALDGSKCRVEQVLGSKLKLKRVDYSTSTQTFDAMPEEIRRIA